MSDPATFVPAATWQNLSSGGVQVTPILTVPNATYLAPAGGQNGLTGTADRELIYLAGTATRLDGGQQFLLWDAASVTPAAGATVFNPWAIIGTPGRWKSAGPITFPGLLANGVTYFDGTSLKTNTGLTYNITQLALTGRLLVARNTASVLPDLDAQAPVRIVGLDGASNFEWMFGAGTGISTGLFGLTARGTIAAPTATQDGDTLVLFSGGGYGATQWKQGSGGCSVTAVGNWTDTQQGSEFVVATTTVATATPSINRLKVRQGLMTLSGAGSLPAGGDPGPGSLNLFGTLQFAGVPLAGNVPATATNDNAATGNVGQLIRATASGVAMSNGVSQDIVTQLLQPGDYDVWGSVTFGPAGTTTISGLAVASNTVANTLASTPDESTTAFNLSFTTGQTNTLPVNSKRFSLAAPTTVRIVAFAAFGVSTMTCSGALVARRRR